MFYIEFPQKITPCILKINESNPAKATVISAIMIAIINDDLYYLSTNYVTLADQPASCVNQMINLLGKASQTSSYEQGLIRPS